MMIWNNECRQMQRRLALWVGNDLPEHEAVGMERHLAVCPHCREVYNGLRQSQPVLGARTRVPAAAPHELGSVWPGVARQMRTLDDPPVVPGWHRWLPTGTLAAACVAVVAALLPAGFGLDSPVVPKVAHQRTWGSGVPTSSVGTRPKSDYLLPDELQRRVLWRGVFEPDNYRNF